MRPEQKSRLSGAAISGLAVAAWYCLPDVVHRPGWLTLARIGVVGATTAVISQLDSPEAADLEGLEQHFFPELSAGKLVAATSALLVGSLALGVAAEVMLYRRGERRRTAGVRWAHSRQALVLGAAAAAAAGAGGFVDDQLKNWHSSEVPGSPSQVDEIPGPSDVFWH